MPEWLIGTVSKTVYAERHTRVRIPPSPLVFRNRPWTRTAQGFLPVKTKSTARSSSSTLRAGYFTIPHALTQLVSRSHLPRFESRPPFDIRYIRLQAARWRHLSVEWAAHAQARFGHDVRVDHGCLDIFVAEQFLHGANVVAVLQQVRRERVPQGVAGDSLADPRHVGGLLDRSVHCPGIGVPTNVPPRLAIQPDHVRAE